MTASEIDHEAPHRSPGPSAQANPGPRKEP